MSNLEPGGTTGGGHRKRPSYNDLGIILRTYKLGESDRILRVMTREHGKKSAVAKGVRKTKSRFGARLEPLTCVSAMFHVGRSMDVVSQAEIEKSFKEVRGDLELYFCGSAMAELVDGITQEHEPHPEVFDLLLEGLQLLGDRPQRAMLTLAFFEFNIMSAAGFELMVTDCAGCGAALGSRDVSFSLALGGLVCESCRGDRSGRAGKMIRVGPRTAGLLYWMASHRPGEWPQDSDADAEREACLLMDGVLEHWLEKEFRSRRVMRKLPGARERGTRGEEDAG